MESMTKRQMMASIETMLEFTKGMLARSLTTNERSYYEGRRFCLQEMAQMASQLPEGMNHE